MDRGEQERRIREVAQGNRLSCDQAHALAAELRMTPEDLGRICNELKIKIVVCRLGCF